MNFAVPTAFFWSLLAAPIIVFYILKIRLRRVETSTALFWNQIYDEKPPRSIWETLRHLLSLFLQLAMLALLVLAVTDPFFPWQIMAARRVVLVVDPSASMNAHDVAPTRFDAALKAATRIAEGLRFRDEMAIVLAGEHPQVVCGMSGHVPTMKRSIGSLRRSDAPTKLKTAIELGQRLIGEHPHGEIVVLTDGCSLQTESLAATEKIKLRIFGADAGNVGITQFQVRRSLVDPLGYELLASVRNASPTDVECRLEIELDGAAVDVLPLKLKPNETWTRSLEKTSLTGGRLVGRIRQAATASTNSENAAGAEQPAFVDQLASDDIAFAILPPRKIQNVLLVTPGNLFLQKVFEANPLVRLEVAGEFPAAWPQDTIIVLHRQLPRTLPPGDVWIIDPEGSCDLWEIGSDLANPIITQQDADSPLMTHVKLENVIMPEARQLKFRTPPHVLAGAVSGDAVYAEVKRESGKFLALTVNLDKGDLTFRTAFPILVTNALGWFAGGAGELRPSLTTGAVPQVPITSTEHEDLSDAVMRAPDGTIRPLTFTAKSPTTTPTTAAFNVTTATVGPLDQVGVWTIEKPGREQAEAPRILVELPCNLADENETAISTPEPLRHQAEAQLLTASWMARPLWFYLAAARSP